MRLRHSMMPAAMLVLVVMWTGGCSLYEKAGGEAGESYAIDGLIDTGSESYAFVEDSSASAHFKSIAIDYTIRNDTNHPLFVARCLQDEWDNAVPQPELLKLQDGEWMLALSSLCHAVFLEPITIAQGETYKGVGSLIANLTYNTEPTFADSLNGIPGTYKIYIPVYTEFRPDRPFRLAAMEYRLSSEFQVLDAS